MNKKRIWDLVLYMIRNCTTQDTNRLYLIINEAAKAYAGMIPPDCYHQPYMPVAELEAEMKRVTFFGWEEGGELVAVMGMEPVKDVTLIRHAYTLPEWQGRGIGGKLLEHLRSRVKTGRLLVGTWADAKWAVAFYEKHGFKLMPDKDELLKTYWEIPERQVDTSVVLFQESLITAVGIGYFGFIVPDFLNKAFESIKNRGFNLPDFKTNDWELCHSSAAILLAAVGIETLRNRLFYFKGQDINKYSHVSDDICNLLSDTISKDKLLPYLREVFVVRDVITHNHLYEMYVNLDKNTKVHSQKLLGGYGNKNYRSCVDFNSCLTKTLNLNVQPFKIGFEDIFKVLIIVDVVWAITRKTFAEYYLALRPMCQIDGRWFETYSELLTYYFNCLPNCQVKDDIERLSKKIRKELANFIPTTGSDCFVLNICPNCSALGFDNRSFVKSCRKCDFSIRIAQPLSPPPPTPPPA